MARPPHLEPPDPPLTDGVIRLRPARADDADGLYEEGRDEQTHRWVNVPRPYTRAHARDEADGFAACWDDPGLPVALVIAGVDDDRYRGILLLFTDRPGNIAEVAYGAHPAARGASPSPAPPRGPRRPYAQPAPTCKFRYWPPPSGRSSGFCTLEGQ